MLVKLNLPEKTTYADLKNFCIESGIDVVIKSGECYVELEVENERKNTCKSVENRG